MKHLKPIALAGVVAALFLNTNLAGGEPFHHPFGELREYHKHWISVCPDIHEPDSNSDYRTNCWASTWTGNEDGTMSGAFPGDRLSVHRNRTTGDMKVTIAAIFVDEIDRSRPVRVKFSGGHRAEYTFGEAFIQHQNFGNEYTFAAGDTTADIIRRMRAGNHITITLPLHNGEHAMFYSLQGLRDAMAFTEQYAGSGS